MSSPAETLDKHENLPNPAGRSLPGEGGVWVLILCDLMLFTVFFLSFLHARGQDPASFVVAKEHVNQAFGTFNTILLLCSSWFVVMGIHSARRDAARAASRLFITAAGCGLGFAVVKMFEYREKLLAGIVPNTSEFFNYYYFMTGLHFLHVLIGVPVLIAMSQYGRFDAPFKTKIGYLECGASFWHLVDLLWIVLFALLYLLP